jgi:Ser/Thr protein kinase RdoA (MazF antagonist)
MNPQTNYDALDPDTILNAVDSQGFISNAHMLSLNSYENRVYQIGLEAETENEDEGAHQSKFVIAKFYRPERWSNEQILEEHEFSKKLADQEIPVVAPLANESGETLFEFEGFRFALFTRKGGYAPEPGNLEQLERLGALLGRIHQYGQEQKFKTRESLSIERMLLEPKNFLFKENFIPEDLEASYQNIFEILLESISRISDNFKNSHFIKLHGDWHLGNILWLEESGGHIVDLDDCINGPAMQDIWMMLSGDQHEQALQLRAILKGYEQFCYFDRSELKLLESLRTMRIVFYTAWLAKRWDDPAFPMNFPWFNTRAYWQQHIRELQDQIPLIESNLFDL